MQLAHAASRHDGDMGADARNGRDSKVRGRDMNDGGRTAKQVRLDNDQGAGVDAQTLHWASAPPPAYGNPHDPHGTGAQPSQYAAHGLDQSGMPLGHADPSFDPSAYADDVQVDDGGRMQGHDGSKSLTSESTGLVGARGKTGMTRTLSTSRRAEQNRNAQRVFRERKNKYITDLENKAASLEGALLAAEEHRRRFNDALETIEILKRDNDTLRVALRALGGHQAVPSAPALPLDRSAAHAQALLPGAYGAASSARGPHDAHDPSHAQGPGHGAPGGLSEPSEGQDSATAAAVAAAASGSAPYWLLEAVSNANQQHGFPVSGHFQPPLGDNMTGSAQATHAPMQHGDGGLRGTRGQQATQRHDGMIDPSLDQSRMGGLDEGEDTRQGARVDDGKAGEMHNNGNPDSLASLSAVAAAAAAANSQKQ
ncbi:hypothetical protein MVES1_001910 [Malassezia vespertilionis]|uniref:BZIP domain-containing protein n=1 Tax=Malassezia vespertilionis TaxID=2020962 RepID=A0A2N1JCY3_9BASI|nr:uncharacterized protein MVES1_001910 [Malassezia vespertilionis]PKI84430.1 hypothetical protein MVES_001812 [Malassezia vespertilionis]WFD06559.1 hypothetical protein MVES1_001910 [Malassezia vespertilionis]